MNISITGFKGAGKSTIAALLARKLDKKLIVLEEELAKKIKNPSKFAEKNGLERLQEIESEILESVCEFDDCIFDISHSTIHRNENIINLKRSSMVIALTADPKTIHQRASKKQKESSYERLLKELQEHELKSKNAADYSIDTSKLSPEEVSDLIIHYIQLEMQ